MVSKTSLRCVEQLAACDSQAPDRNVRFEYEILPLEKRAAIEQLTTEIKKELQKTAHILWEIGKKLAEVRSQIETCGFNSWLKTEFNWSRRTAYKLISVYEAFPEFSRAQYAQLDISASALYLLAAPSTHPQIRSHFLELALAGNNISHQSVRAFINEFKEIPTDRDRLDPSRILAANGFKDAVPIDSQPLKLQDPYLDVAVAKADIRNSDLEVIELAATNEQSASLALRPGWNSIEAEFSLFWGDTTSPRFIERLPEDAFVLAVPSCKWHHDWLLNESRSCINITRSKLDKELVTKLLSVLALSKKAIIFPWLPNWKIIEIALDLNMKVYAGDPELDRCQGIISRLGLERQRLDRDLRQSHISRSSCPNTVRLRAESKLNGYCHQQDSR